MPKEERKRYRVLVSDDEKRVCKLICNLIDWEALGAEIVGTANDGVTACRMAVELKPDIMITDIRMPGLDGLELIGRIREMQLDIDFIIISGYRQFDYAQKAIRYGVEDYILKPINEKELIDMVKKVIRKREESRSLVEGRAQAEAELRENEKLLRKNTLSSMLDGEPKADTGSALGIAEHDSVQVMIIKPDIDCDLGQFETYRALLRKTEETADRVFEEVGCHFVCAVKDEGVYVILNPDTAGEVESAMRRIKKEMMLQNSAFFPKFTITAGISTVKTGIAEVPRCVWEARHAVLNRLFLGTGEIIRRFERPVSEPLKTETVFSRAVRSSFLDRVEVFDTEEVRAIVRDLGRKTYQFKNADGRFVERLADTVLSTYLYATTALHDERETRELREKWKHTFVLCVTCREVFDELADFIAADLSACLERQNQAEARPVREAKKYLQEHFSEPVRLDDVAGMVGFNATYFSTLFKKETGENFSDYLIGLRVSRAKVLLTDTDEVIADISEEVGYTDLKYFSKIFKRVTGLNPSEYRKLYHKIG